MNQITLRAIRESCGYTVEESAKLCGISVDAMNEFETDSSLIPVWVLRKLKELYKMPLMLIKMP